MMYIMDLLTDVGGFNNQEALSMLVGTENARIRSFHEHLTESAIFNDGFELGVFSNKRNFKIYLSKDSVSKFDGRSVCIVTEGGMICIFNSECDNPPEEGPYRGEIMRFDTDEELVEHLIRFWKN